MNGKDIELSRRRVLGGIATVGAASAAAGAGTFAYFSDEEASDGNTITAGTLDLKDTSSGVINVGNLAPGQTVPSDGSTIVLDTTYEGTINPEVDLSISLAGSEALANALVVDEVRAVRDSDALSGSNLDFSNDLSTDVSSLSDLAGLDKTDAFGDVSGSDILGLELGLTFPSTVSDNSLQGESIDINVTFDARQSEDSQ